MEQPRQARARASRSIAMRTRRASSALVTSSGKAIRAPWRRPRGPDPEPEAQAIHGDHRGRLGVGGAAERASVDDERVGVILVHVLEDPRRHVGQGVDAGRAVGRSVDPVHGREAARRSRGRRPRAGGRRSPRSRPSRRRSRGARGRPPRLGRARRLGTARTDAHQRDPPGRQGIPGPVRLRDEQAGPRVGGEVLRVDRHRADQEEGLAGPVEGVGHERRERMPRVAARHGGQRPRPRPVHEGPGALGVGRLGDRRAARPGRAA